MAASACVQPIVSLSLHSSGHLVSSTSTTFVPPPPLSTSAFSVTVPIPDPTLEKQNLPRK
eukprot:757617-Hanusia_phi.AAC.2